MPWLSLDEELHSELGWQNLHERTIDELFQQRQRGAARDREHVGTKKCGHCGQAFGVTMRSARQSEPQNHCSRSCAAKARELSAAEARGEVPERRKAKTMAQRKYDAVKLAPAKQEKAELKLLASALIASGMSMRAAAKHMGIDRTTIAKWVKSKEASQ